ncbi:MAG: PH domain-containing protein [Paludibacteraceae bacterium]|nr:PH domain-containing protein [Paludibacteraceae bacterium]
MNKKIIYEGSPSQVVNLGSILLGIIFCWLFVPLVMMIARILKTRCTRTTISSTEIISERGVFSKTTDEVLLARVTDVRLSQPFWLRVFGMSNLYVTTTDVTTNLLSIRGVKNGKQIWCELREAVAEQRRNVHEQEIRQI